MRQMNRSDRRTLDRDVKKSIGAIRAHLEFLNAAGNPKYQLVVIGDTRWKAMQFMRRLKFWRRRH